MLLEAVRTVSTASRHLEAALDKLNKSARLYEERRTKNEGPLRRLLQRIFSREKSDRIYEVEYVDVSTSAKKRERIDFDRFLEEGTRLSQVLGSLSNRMSPRYGKLESSGDDEIFKNLERITIELQKNIKALPALHEYLSSEMSRETREKLQGIRLEINGIKNAVVKTNQKRYDYISRKEEEQQMKKLGIEGDQTPDP